MQKKGLIVNVVISLLIIGAAYGVGYVMGEGGFSNLGAAALSTPDEEVDLTPFWKAWNVLDEKFVAASTSTDPISNEDRLWGAITGLTDSYGDPHTNFFPPVESKEFADEVSGNFEGVGMEVGIRNSLLTVIAPLKDTPADRAGMRAGDIIIKIDDFITADATVEEAVRLIRGPKGTPVVLTIVRDSVNEPFDISITRDKIDIPTIKAELDESGVFIISLYNFSAISPNLFRGALRDFIHSDSDKMLIDLRNNPGGFLEASLDMASWFLPSGKTIVSEDFGGRGDPIIHRSKGFDIFNHDILDVAILVNQGSASASEILAGALAEHGIATIIGEKTFGKGSVQELVSITDKTSLKVTIARWLTPDGNSISDGGLTPDIEVEYTIEDLEAGVDPQLERGIEFLTTGQ